MPPHPALANSVSFYPGELLTSSITLTLSFAFLTGASYGSQSVVLPDGNRLTLQEKSILTSGEGAEPGIPIRDTAEFDHTPAQIAQLPQGVPLQAGMAVPWPGVQGMAVSSMPVGFPGMPPTAIPDNAMNTGNWMMVWMPYTVPVNLGAPESTGQVGQTMTVFLPAWAYTGSTQGQGTVTQPPVAYSQAMVPQRMYPQVMAQPPYAQQPEVQPYARVAPPTLSPLAVPALPHGPNTSVQTVLSPPPSPPPSVSSAPLNPSPAEEWTTPAPVTPGISLGPSTMALDTVPASSAPSANVAVPNRPLTEPNLDLQGLYVLQGDNSSARARVSGQAFLTPSLLVGGALDIATGPDLTDSDGVDLTELYLATSIPGAPGLRFRLGQLDLTSYFDRNSFAKDIARDFFNATFHTNPALISGANVTASRPAGLVQWAVTDDITLNAAAFSSAPNITDFALDGFASEVGVRTGNLIVRGTFLTSRDTQFQGTGGRLDAYGVNAEWFIPEANIGLFGRYGHLNNSGTGFSGDTYSFGLNALDVFMENDRLGLGYGRNLTTAVAEGKTPDVLEVFYDFEVMPHIRLGFTFQQRDQFRESYAGFRVRGDLDLLPQQSME